MGDDEHGCLNRICLGLFKCINSDMCLHYHSVEDGVIHCKEGDDEVFADLPPCPRNCMCLMDAVTCINTSVSWNVNQSFHYISISESVISLSRLHVFPVVAILKLPKNNLHSFCLFKKTPQLYSVKYLDLSMNKIVHLHKSCFKTLNGLEQMILSRNKIKNLHSESFVHLLSLVYLDLSYNNIRKVTGDLFKILNSLKYINLIEIYTREFSWISFKSKALKVAITTDFHICCSVLFSTEGESVCTAEVIWPFTCSDLLGSKTLAIFVWVFSLTILSLNIISFNLGVCRLKKFTHITHNATFSEGKFCYELNITSLHAVDCLNGCHLLSLISASTYYGDTYIVYDILWREGLICNTVSAISLFSNVMSIYILGFLAVSRMLIIKFPFDKKGVNNPGFVMKVLSFGSFFLSIFAIISTVVTNSGSDQGQALPLCVMYGVAGNIYTIITSIYGMIQLTAVILIPSIYIYVLQLLHSHDNLSMKDKSGRNTNFTKTVLLKLLLVNISNIICWLPSCIVLLLSLILGRYPIQLLFWVVLVLSPVNSILNPIILRLGQN